MRSAFLTAGLLLAAVAANAQQSTPGAQPAIAPAPTPFRMPEMCDFKTRAGDAVTAPCAFEGLKLIGKADMSKFRMPPAPKAPGAIPAKPAAK